MRSSIIGVDIGSTTTGVALFILEDFKIVDIESYLINTILVEGRYRPFDFPYKLDRLSRGLKSIIRDDTFAISLENPFIFSKRPTSVIPLGKVLGILEATIVSVNPSIYIRRISPSEVKKHIGVHGNSGDKADMLRAIKRVNELQGFIEFDFISEHEIDAVAIAYELLEFYRENPYQFI